MTDVFTPQDEFLDDIASTVAAPPEPEPILAPHEAVITEPARLGSFDQLLTSTAASNPAGTSPFDVATIVAADTITAENIVAGSITTAELAVGQSLPAANLILNGGFRNGLTNWSFNPSGAPGGAVSIWNPSGADWTLRDGDVDNWTATGPYGSTAYITGTNTGGSFVPYLATAPEIPVTPGEFYSASALLGLHRLTSAYIQIDWFNSAGTYLSSVGSQVFHSPAAGNGGPARTGWNYATIDGVQAPATANQCHFLFVANTPNVSGTDWYLFMDQAWMGVGKLSKPYDPNEVLGVRNASGHTIIDSAGIHVSNGEIDITDFGGKVVMTGAGFAGPWDDYIATKVYNNTFSNATVGAFGNGDTDLPYWTTAVSAHGTLTGENVAGTPSSRRIKFALTAGGNSADESYIQQLLPIPPPKANNSYQAVTVIEAPWVQGNVKINGSVVYLLVAFYKADGVTQTGSTYYNAITHNGVNTISPDHLTARTPSDAAVRPVPGRLPARLRLDRRRGRALPVLGRDAPVARPDRDRDPDRERDLQLNRGR